MAQFSSCILDGCWTSLVSTTRNFSGVHVALQCWACFALWTALQNPPHSWWFERVLSYVNISMQRTGKLPQLDVPSVTLGSLRIHFAPTYWACAAHNIGGLQTLQLDILSCSTSLCTKLLECTWSVQSPGGSLSARLKWYSCCGVSGTQLLHVIAVLAQSCHGHYDANCIVAV